MIPRVRCVLAFAAPLFIALGSAGCGPRVLVQPMTMDYEKGGYIYFVEQEAGKDSRLKRCEILSDNRVDCTVQFDLD